MSSTYRIKPEPLECWMNVYEDIEDRTHSSKEEAEKNAANWAIRVAVHMKEVVEEKEEVVEKATIGEYL